ncbi:MAG: hypothetical protein JNM07_01505 [Phycisphaerae bacterium]|nr:hypothetical protein [Phycisphaerae bacterium]
MRPDPLRNVPALLRIAPDETPRAAQWPAALARLDLALARTLKNDGDVRVVCADMLGRPVVVKLWTLRSLPDRLKAMLGASRAHRHWRGGACLLAAGIPTARPIALLRDAAPGSPPRMALVMEHLSGPTALEALADRARGPRARHDAARAVARTTAALVHAGLFNRDHKPSNLILTTRAGTLDAAVIDTVAIRRLPRHQVWRPLRTLASLVIEPTGVGLPPPRTLIVRVVHEYLRVLFAREAGRPVDDAEWRPHVGPIIDRVSRLVRAHGDPTPRVNPLAPHLPPPR